MSDVKSFLSHIEHFFTYGYTLVSMILGYELGLFNSLKDSKTPLTSSELADVVGYKERYVREWLGSMSAANIITVQSEEGREGTCVYHLSEEHFNVVELFAVHGKGVFACHNRIGILRSCFEKDGPVGDAKAFEGENWEYFEEYREKTGEKEILNDILPKVESLSEYKAKLDKGCKVLDLGCGTGILTLCMAERHPKSSFVGIDVIDDCLLRARVQCKKKGLSNVRFTNTTLESFIEDSEEKLDLVTSFQVLHNLPDPITTIQHLHSLLKPSGKLILSEIDVSSNHLQNVGNLSNAFLYAVSLFYCLNYSMSDKPHVGYGVGWGKENMLKALKEYFILDASFQLGFSTRLYLLSKRATL